MLSRISSKGIYKHISSNCVCPISVLSLYLLLCICTCSLEKIKKKSWYCVFIIVIVLYFCCICICNEILFNKWNVRQHSHPVGWKDAAVSGTCVTKKNMVLVLYLYCIYYVLVLKCQTTQSRRKGATVSGTCVTNFFIVFVLYFYCIYYVLEMDYVVRTEMSE